MASSIPLEKLKARLKQLQEAREQARALHNVFFDLHLPEEVLGMHKIIHDLDIRIEQIEMLIRKHTDSIDNAD